MKFYIGHKTSRGFTLVEILVAMVIGLVTTIVIFQVFSVSEERKRSVTGAGDTQNIGAIALTTLKNQITHAGYGFTSAGDNMSMNVFGCRVSLKPSGVTLPQLAPVIINPKKADGSDLIPDRDDNTDTLLIVYGTPYGAQEGTFLMNTSEIDPEGSGMTTTNYTVPSAITFAVGDLVLAASSNIHPGCEDTDPLKMSEVTNIYEGTHISVDEGAEVSHGVLYSFGTKPGTGAYTSEQVPHARAYRIKDNVLEECDFMRTDCTLNNSTGDIKWIEVAPDIVSLRAQYRLTDGTFTQTIPVIAGKGVHYGFANILGVRFVIVTRSPQPGKTDLTTTINEPTWSGQSGANAAPIDLSNLSDDWQRYRYATLETSASIRNVVWMGEPQ